MIVASPMRPLRKRYMYRPTKSASGIDIADRERAPRAVLERVDDREAEAGERDDDDEQDGDGGGGAGDRADLGARDVGERAPAAARRRPQNDQVVDGAGEADAGDQPDEPGRVAELRGEHRADQRAGARDRREVVAEQHPAVGGVVVVAVGADMRRRRPRVVQRHDARRDERAVVAVGDGEDARGSGG